MLSKSLLRKKALAHRQALSLKSRKRKSQEIRKTLEALPRFRKARHILLYYSVKNEVDTLPLLKKYAKEKKLYLPAIAPEGCFQALPFTSWKALKKGIKGIPEPSKGNPPKQLDLMVVPGVAFDQSGHRLGMGKGYYDRFLVRYPQAFKIGLAYCEQMVEKIPVDPYDVPMNLVITD